MKPRLSVSAYALVCAVLLITACAAPAPAPRLSNAASWHGRLALRIEPGLPDGTPQAFSAGFELSGNAQSGTLTLLTPLGSTAAAMTWSPGAASLRSNGEARQFDSLDALLRGAVGTDVPVVALFAWLRGEAMTLTGWSADLSQYASGRITARRLQPAPATELTLLLEP